jgi:hypothetical protein
MKISYSMGSPAMLNSPNARMAKASKIMIDRAGTDLMRV